MREGAKQPRGAHRTGVGGFIYINVSADVANDR